MGKFHGTFFNTTKHRDAYIAATHAVERAKATVEDVKRRMMQGGVEDMAELETAQEELAAARMEADRLPCLWLTGKEPGEAAQGMVWKNELGQVIDHG